jgi:sigma-B regulation protein RsbU (phosphoserine phosphatase)
MPLPSIHVLIIGDNEAHGARLTRPFAGWGWGVRRAPSEPDEALARLREERFDLVLLDLDAAERDDYAFLRGWRADAVLSDVPVVITTRPGVTMTRLARCVEHGASDYITHPHQHTLLRARLQNVLQRKLLQEQAQMALGAFNEIEKIADDLRLVILPLGAALSAETDYDRLVARIVEEAQTISNADVGALYLAHDDGRLHYTYVRVRSLDFTYRDPPGGLEAFAPMPLTDPETGQPNHKTLLTHVALGGGSVNLTNLRDARFDLSQLMLFEERFRPYRVQSCLMVPLRSGQITGVLLLANSTNPLSGEAVPFDAYHQLVAEALASLAAIVLNNRQLSEREARLLRYKRELEIGREIQLSFLPARLPNPPGWELVSHFRPALEVAGDFYDAFVLPHGHIALIISDVVGKGVTAALFMAIIRSLFRALFQQNYFHAEPTATGGPAVAAMTPFSFVDRGALLNAVRLTNAYLIGNHGDTYAFATLWAAVLDPESGRLLYVNAGHNPPLVVGRLGDGSRATREQLHPTGPAIGLMPNAGYWLAETRLTPDDLLFAYTDGATEARNAAAEELGLEQLEAALHDAPSAHEALAAVEAALREHTGDGEAFDDVTLLAVRRLPVEE